MTSPRDTSHVQALTWEWPKVEIVQKKNHDPISWGHVLTVVFLSPQALDSSICCAIATSLWYQMWPQEFIWGSPLTKLPCWVKSGFPEPHRRRIKDHIHDPRGLVSLPSWDSKHTIFHVSSLISYWLKKSDMFLRITSSLKKPWQNSSSGIIRLLLSFSLSLPYA